MPMILILYVMPLEETEWIKVSPRETVMKRCAWWCSLQGLPHTSNTDKLLISIPIHPILTPEALKELLEKTRRGETL